MADVRGEFVVTADGKEYRLHLGFSGLADLQEKFGDDFLSKLDPPEGAGEVWMPPLRIVVGVILVALRRYHPELAGDEARYAADAILATDRGVLQQFLAASFPQSSQGASGNGERPKAVA
jgi:hypothetical protein